MLISTAPRSCCFVIFQIDDECAVVLAQGGVSQDSLSAAEDDVVGAEEVCIHLEPTGGTGLYRPI